MAISVDIIPNRNSPPAVLLREAWREGTRIRRKTLANLSKAPPELVAGIRAMLKGGVVVTDIDSAVNIRRSLPHGHVAAALGVARKLGLERILARDPSRMRSLALAAVISRILEPGSKLACARSLSSCTATSSLGTMLGLGEVREREMLNMLDWLRERQPWIERSLANRHLREGSLLLYDVTSSFVEGRSCPLAAFGYSRDGRKGKRQITFGLLCAEDGCPLAVEVFAGNAADPTTLSVQVNKVKKRFRIGQLAMVGDRGMITSARVREDLKPLGLDWISALKSTSVRKLAEDDPPAFDPACVEEDAVTETSSPRFPNERLLACFNPRVRDDRKRKREALLVETEALLEDIAGAPSGSDFRDRVLRRIGREANRFQVEKHFDIEVTDQEMRWRRNPERIARESRLDGIYVVRTSLADIAPDKAVLAYKGLSRVERAFRAMKTDRLRVRPIYVYAEEHVRGHVFLCMLAWHLEWHMRKRLAPILFEDEDPAGAHAKRTSSVGEARVSDSAERKAVSKRTPDGLPVHGMSTLLADLRTLTLNQVELPSQPGHPFTTTSEPTPLQERAFELLKLQLPGPVAM